MNIKEISASSRISFKQPTKSGDVFYTFEYSETWSTNPEENNVEQLKTQLWETVNNQVLAQAHGTRQLYQQAQQ